MWWENSIKHHVLVWAEISCGPCPAACQNKSETGEYRVGGVQPGSTTHTARGAGEWRHDLDWVSDCSKSWSLSAALIITERLLADGGWAPLGKSLQQREGRWLIQYVTWNTGPLSLSPLLESSLSKEASENPIYQESASLGKGQARNVDTTACQQWQTGVSVDPYFINPNI